MASVSKCIAFLALVPIAAAVGNLQQHPRPDLYTDDSPPKGALGFKPIYPKHPPPAPSDWEKDLLDDDDSDGGYWDAQMTYDRLRASHAKREAQVKEAFALSDQLKKEVENARENEEEARKDMKESAAEEGKLKEQLDSLHGDVKVAKKELEEAEAAVKDDTAKIKDLKGAIKDAKKKLKQLEENKKKNSKKAEKVIGNKEEAVEEAKKDMKNLKDEVKALEKKLDDKEAVLEKSKDAAAAAAKTAEATKAKFDAAAEKLRALRNGEDVHVPKDKRAGGMKVEWVQKKEKAHWWQWW
mmetsp:Transcript_77491/g.136678  ORF Transcript_77491/g.136678 Transcript_77491/m.136678 type:complete len:297 (+) Transcript_77491:58-948(+)